MTETTAGPWEISFDKKTIWGPFPRRKMIAEVMAEFAEGDQEEQRANARLIAAAPDLLEVCEQLSVDSYGIAIGTLNDLRSAIAKARGE